MNEQYNLKIKVCLIGDTSVGKTSLVRRYVMDVFDDKYILTLGTKISKKRLLIKKNKLDINLTLAIWDVMGQKYFTNIFDKAFKGAKAAILVCDVTREDTLKNILMWESRLKEVTGDIPLLLLANKSDLTGEYEFSETDLQKYSSGLHAPFFMTSAKCGDNVINSFYKIGELVTTDIFN
jgi:small GTP-binding protein